MLKIVSISSSETPTSPRMNPITTTATESGAMSFQDGTARNAASEEELYQQHKEPTASPHFSLKRIAMTAGDLSQFCFSNDLLSDSSAASCKKGETPIVATSLDSNVVPLPFVIPVSSSSSTCTRESDSFSDAEGGSFSHSHSWYPGYSGHHKPTVTVKSTPITTTTGASMNTLNPSALERCVSDRFNAKVSSMTKSRQGRSSQRWSTDAQSLQPVRLVTGCVPILKGGKILLVSSNRKPEWILPKGGWERDEQMEESAIRETFEEAGVIGTLGPRLSDVQYETRKAKKRRLQQEQELFKVKFVKSADDNKSYMNTKATQEKGEQPLPQHSSQAHDSLTVSIPETSDQCPAMERLPAKSSPDSLSSPATSISAPVTTKSTIGTMSSISKEALSTIRDMSASNKLCDETASICSTSTVATNGSAAYSQVRMFLFPLYVSKVYEEWPEHGRLRRAVPIDEAIELLDARPEFKLALLEVKKRGFHLEHHHQHQEDEHHTSAAATTVFPSLSKKQHQENQVASALDDNSQQPKTTIESNDSTARL